jgi:hypothetical protein
MMNHNWAFFPQSGFQRLIDVMMFSSKVWGFFWLPGVE